MGEWSQGRSLTRRPWNYVRCWLTSPGHTREPSELGLLSGDLLAERNSTFSHFSEFNSMEHWSLPPKFRVCLLFNEISSKNLVYLENLALHKWETMLIHLLFLFIYYLSSFVFQSFAYFPIFCNQSKVDCNIHNNLISLKIPRKSMQ